MDRGKRASMREGPLSALFRDTASLDEETNGNAAPAAKPEAPRQEVAPEPPRVEPPPMDPPMPAPKVPRRALIPI